MAHQAHHFSNGREIKKGDIFIYTDKKGKRRRGKIIHLSAGPQKSIATIPNLPHEDTLALLKQSLHRADAPRKQRSKPPGVHAAPALPAPGAAHPAV